MKILVIFTGGTIGSTCENGIISPDSDKKYRLLEKYYANGGKAEFDTAQPYTVLSENLNGEHLRLLYKCIKESISLNIYDGIIVTHGTDTLQYTSAFLSYMLGLCDTPVVLVSSNYPIDNPKANGVDNFTAAVEFISSKGGCGVFTAYKNKESFPQIHRASRLLNHLAYDDCVYSVDYQSFGEVSGGNFVKNINYTEKEDEFISDTELNLLPVSPILKITPYVGMCYPEIGDNIKAILLEGYHSGTINTADEALRNFCLYAKKINIPVFLTGSRQGFFYESKVLFDELSIDILPPVAPIAAYMKLWILASGNFDISENFKKSRGGDLFDFS
ncbi:MAG: asparaginase [Ruminococcus sp.]|nr:asparaginase [Ruminococcus sp.]